MASTYSNLKIQLMATGENTTTWGDVTNVNIGAALGAAIAASVTITFSSADQTLTWTDTNGPQDARFLRLNLTGTATSGYNLIVPAITGGKPYIVNNGTDGTITVKNSTGTGIAVPAGKTMWVYNNGTNVVDVVTHLTSLTLSTPLAVTSGGTGGNTASTARTALGAAASGANSDITSLSGLTTPLSVAQGGTGGNTATDARTALSAAKSGANSDITSLSGLTTALTVGQGGTGVNTVTGILKGNGTSAFTAASAGTDYVAPGGALGTPSSGTLTNCTFPTLNQNTTGSAGSLATTNFSIVESGGVLYIKYGSTNIAKITSTGAFTALNNVTGFGSV